MKKSLFIISGILLILFACEKDDFCVSSPVTPNLVVRFYDANDIEETLDVDSLYVWAEGKDTIFSNSITDSISLPLNTIAPNTVYHLAQGTQKLETITIEYSTEDDYVSRSCGFRVIFNDVIITQDEIDDEGWIESLSTTKVLTIDNQDEAHVKVFH